VEPNQTIEAHWLDQALMIARDQRALAGRRFGARVCDLP
jgi:hypothetical protein